MIIESLDDFRKRYRNTYVFLEINGKNHLVNYESDDEESFIFISPTFGDLIVNEKTAREKISFYFPKAGLYNLASGMTDVTRYPARQWRRAPCHENTRFKPITNIIAREPTIRNLFSFETARQLFFPEFAKTTHNAIESLHKKGTAINRLFGVTKAPEKYDAEYILWYRQSPVGIIDQKKQEITVRYVPLYQEVCDHYTKKEPTWQVNLKT